MKLLLDECVPIGLRHYFTVYEAVTSKFQGFTKLKNGRLLRAAVSAGFEVLVTLDQNMQYEQNMVEHPIAIIVFHVYGNNFAHLVELASELEVRNNEWLPGAVYHLHRSQDASPFVL